MTNEVTQETFDKIADEASTPEEIKNFQLMKQIKEHKEPVKLLSWILLHYFTTDHQATEDTINEVVSNHPEFDEDETEYLNIRTKDILKA